MGLLGITIDKYKEMAKDYFLTKDMIVTYAKFHTKIKNKDVLSANASRLLNNVNFLRIKEEVAREVEPNLENKINECLNVLYSLAGTAEKKSDRILAATNYLKFTMGEKNRTIMTDERKAELDVLANRCFPTN